MYKLIQALLLISVCGFLPHSIAESVDKTLLLEGASSVNIENVRGKVKILGWDKTEVKVSGEIDKKAERFIFENNGASINVKIVMPKRMRNFGHHQGSDLVIRAPKNVRINFNGVSTDVIVKDNSAGTDIHSVSGNIVAESLSKHVKLMVVSGDIQSKNLSGKIMLSSVSGDIEDENSQGRLNLKAVSGHLKTKSSAREVELNTVSGKIDFRLAQVNDVDIATVSGDVTGQLSLNNSGIIKMSTVSGDANLAFTNNVQANFKLKSNAGGELVNGITADKAIHAKYGPSSKLYFETGDGSASVKASTVSGRIKVSKK